MKHNKKTKLNYKKYFAIILIIAVIGIIISIYSHIERENFFSNADYVSGICSISETVNCGSVLTSKYSEVFGVSLSKIGVLAYLFVALLSLFAIIKPNDEFISYYENIIYFISWLFLLTTFIMAYISAFILNKYCILCIGLYIVNILIFILAHTFRILNKFYK